MRHGTQNKRHRSRNNNTGRRNNGNGNGNQSRTQVYDSNGPDVRIRGTANQVAEKYIALAKDATSAGDHTVAENYFQHAEHYIRIINEMTAGMEANRVRNSRTNKDIADDAGNRNDAANADDTPKPVQEKAPKQADDLGLPASILGAETSAKPAVKQEETETVD